MFMQKGSLVPKGSQSTLLHSVMKTNAKINTSKDMLICVYTYTCAHISSTSIYIYKHINTYQYVYLHT